jgi:uncharacterized protein
MFGLFKKSDREKKAIEGLRNAADMGITEAQFNLGQCYASGVGMPQNHVEAAKWFRKAADQNHGKAQGCLGICYYKGEGVPRDYAEAVKTTLGKKLSYQNRTM